MTKVLLTTQVCDPEQHPTAVMLRELATGLAARGFGVTIAAGLPHHPTGQVPAGYRRRFALVEQHEGFRVVRQWHPTSTRRSIAVRAFVMATQALAIGVSALRARRHDVVLSFGGPPLVGPLISGAVARIWGVPLVTLVHDVYPDVAVESGAVRSRLVIWLARWMETLQHRVSRKLIVIGEATRNLLVGEKRVDPRHVEVLKVWLDPDEIRPADRSTAFRRELGVSDEQFVVLYSGTAGLISGAELLEQVAHELPPDVVMLVVGGGEAWKKLDAVCKAGRAPPNLRVVGYQPRERLNEVQASSDLSLVTLLPGRGRTSVPSKVQGYMAAGRPVLAAVEADCDTALTVRRGDIGMVVAPASAPAIVQGILDARSDPERLRSWGMRSRHLFEQEHAQGPIIERYASILREVAGVPPPRQ